MGPMAKVHCSDGICGRHCERLICVVCGSAVVKTSSTFAWVKPGVQTSLVIWLKSNYYEGDKLAYLSAM